MAKSGTKKRKQSVTPSLPLNSALPPPGVSSRSLSVGASVGGVSRAQNVAIAFRQESSIRSVLSESRAKRVIGDMKASQASPSRRLATTKLTVPVGSILTAPKSLPSKRASRSLEEKKPETPLRDERMTCKEVPDPTPKNGGGGGRRFVPWCDRKH